MKQLLAILIVSLFFSSSTFGLEKDSTKKGIGLVIKYDLITLSLTTKFNSQKNNINGKFYSASVEKLFSKRHSLQYTWYLKTWGENQSLDKFYFHGLNYKFFLSKKKKHVGYYIGSGLKYLNTTNYSPMSWVPPQTLNDPSIQYRLTSIDHYIGAELINGVQFYIWKRLTIDLLLGGGVIGKLNRKFVYQGPYLKKLSFLFV